MSVDIANTAYLNELNNITNMIPGVTGSERVSLMNDAHNLQLAYNNFIATKKSPLVNNA
jgi:hypothetical protein